MDWWFVGYVLIVTVIVYASVKRSIVTSTTWKRYSPFTTFFSILGLILLVYSLSINDGEGAMLGVFWFLAFLTPLYIFRECIQLAIFHRLCLLAVGVLGFYLFRLSLWGIFMLILVAVGLVDTIHL